MNPDDPKFTAHVLGEIEDLTAAERAEIEALLAGDPAAQAEADEMRALAARLRAELPGEAAGALHEEQRIAVWNAASEAATTTTKIVRFPRPATVLKLAAACLVVAASAALLFPAMQVQKNSARKSAVAVAPAAPAEERLLAVEEKPQAPLPPPPQFALATPAPLSSSQPTSLLTVNTSTMVAQTELPKSDVDLSFRPADPQAREADKAINSQRLAANPAFVNGWAKGGASRFAGAAKDVAPEDGSLVTRTGAPSASVPATPSAAAASSVGELAWQRPIRRFAETKALPNSTDVDIAGDHQKMRSLVSGGKFLDDNEPSGAESYEALADNAFLKARENPLSTFSIDVDTASYSIVRRFLNHNQPPPKGAVRIEELLNYFTYEYPQPKGDAPFSATMEVAACPWAPEHRLVRVGLKGREVARDQRPASNLVFLIDVSGSMQPENKLPLLKQSLALLIDQLGAEDQVAIVVYAGNSGCVLPSTHDKRKMHEALRRLEAGGSTNGGSGVQLAYQLAEKSFIKGGTNRVILATDGDWNVGITNRGELLDLIKRKAKSGVFLTVLGVGMDNLKDSMLVKLADSGNGNYAYLDTVLEGRKVLVEQLSGTLVTIAKDVKIQVEFNPAEVGAYRLVGYEKRMLKKEDFNDDKKDAGEIGAGHTVTALYEIVPAGQTLMAMQKPVDALKYQPAPAAAAAPAGSAGSADPTTPVLPPAGPATDFPRSQPEKAPSDGKPSLLKDAGKAEVKSERGEASGLGGMQSAAERKATTIVDKSESRAEGAATAGVSHELLTLKLRYKEPEGDTSKLLEFPLTDRGTPWEQSSNDFRFAAAVAGYGMLLRDSTHKGEATWSAVAEWAEEGKGTDATGYRAEFLNLIEKARAVCR